MRNTFLFILLLLTLTGCVSYSGYGLKPGVSTLPEIVATMGEPAMRWKEPDGREQLAYPRGPAGTQTFMVYVNAAGSLEKIEGVLTEEYFAKIIPDKSNQESVLKLLGPPQPHWTMYFKARDELVWEWKVCDSFSQIAFFNVLFDGTTGVVRTSYLRPDLSGIDGVARFCGR